jgi:hypothetical protein
VRCNGALFQNYSCIKHIAAFQWLDTPPGTERLQVRVLSAIQNWFVGVTANITDCRSVATGSIPVRTALLPGSVMVNISHFDCGVLSSTLSPVTKDKNVGFSLCGKVSVCATEEHGSSPGVNQ